jgi:hypothetical protein
MKTYPENMRKGNFAVPSFDFGDLLNIRSPEYVLDKDGLNWCDALGDPARPLMPKPTEARAYIAHFNDTNSLDQKMSFHTGNFGEVLEVADMTWIVVTSGYYAEGTPYCDTYYFMNGNFYQVETNSDFPMSAQMVHGAAMAIQCEWLLQNRETEYVMAGSQADMAKINQRQRLRQKPLLPQPKVIHLKQTVYIGETAGLRKGQGLGSERCPHEREGHWRTIKNKDGSTRQVRVRKTVIHADRFSQEAQDVAAHRHLVRP